MTTPRKEPHPALPTHERIWTTLEARRVQFEALQARLRDGAAKGEELEGYRQLEEAHALVGERRAALAQQAQAQAALADPELAALARDELAAAEGRLRALESRAAQQVYRRISVCIDADPAQEQAMDAWFSRWSDVITYQSGNHGCGCCVHIWDVEAPNEALAELPFGQGAPPR